MDPLTQGILGAALPQATRRHRHVAIAGICGFLAGLPADLDVLIRSETDPLLFLEYHRHFTHSLIFIPVGGALCALTMHAILRRWWPLPFAQTLLFCTLGYGTHGLLDAATSYGTLLFWPFTSQRYDWSIISVIDPLFTLPALVLIIVAAVRGRPWPARLALAWAGLYLAMGAVQNHKVVDMGREIAAARGHAPTRIEAKPSFGNIVVWRLIYETEGRFHVDAVRPTFSPKVFPGGSVPKLDVARDLPWLDPASQQAEDVERFAWFSQGFVAIDPEHPNRIIDVRYATLPNDIPSLWSIELSPDAPHAAHVQYLTHRRNIREGLATLWRMMTGD